MDRVETAEANAGCCTSKDLRDMSINSGMEVGMQEQMDLLEQTAISLR